MIPVHLRADEVASEGSDAGSYGGSAKTASGKSADDGAADRSDRGALAGMWSVGAGAQSEREKDGQWDEFFHRER